MDDPKEKPKFLRRRWYSYGKLGLKRKKKQKWRNPTGRDNKLREKRRGYQAVVSIGYRTDIKTRGKILERIPIRVENLSDIKKINKNNIVILGNVGNKTRIEIAKHAQQNKIEIYNLNVDKFLKKIEKSKKPKPKEEKNTEKKENIKSEKEKAGEKK